MLSNMYNSADKKSYKDEFEFRSSEEEDLLFAYREEMENLPEIISYIKSLNKEIHKHKSKIEKLHRKIKRLKTKLKERPSTADVGIQTEDLNSFNLEDGQTIEESVKETAEQAMKQTGFVYESTSGMYYDYNTGYYYNAELGLYYDGNSGTYLYYDENEKKYVYHSQVDLPESDAQKSTSNNLEAKRKLKESSSKVT